MINNDNDIKLQNKIYIPQEYINQNYKYNFNGDYIQIRTNQNCRTSNTYQYCNCYYYNWKTNTISTTYECTYNTTSNYNIAYSQISSDIKYSEPLRNTYYMNNILRISVFVIAIIFFIALTKERSSI